MNFRGFLQDVEKLIFLKFKNRIRHNQDMCLYVKVFFCVGEIYILYHIQYMYMYYAEACKVFFPSGVDLFVGGGGGLKKNLTYLKKVHVLVSAPYALHDFFFIKDRNLLSEISPGGY